MAGLVTLPANYAMHVDVAAPANPRMEPSRSPSRAIMLLGARLIRHVRPTTTCDS